MKRFATSVAVLVVGLLALGVWLSAQRDMDRDEDEAVAQPAQTSTMPSMHTQYRGTHMTLEAVREGDVATLAQEWNANLVRLCINAQYTGYFNLPVDNPTCCSSSDLERLDRALDLFEKYGIRVVISLHQFADHRFDGHLDPAIWRNPTLWHEDDLLHAWLDFWHMIASRYAERGTVIYGYDVLNEPHGVSARQWNNLTREVTATIRAVDPHHTIVVESVGYAEPEWFRELEPTGDANTVYSFHMYEPGYFVDQVLWTSEAANYPSGQWNKERLRTHIQPVVDFQSKYGTRILMGEIGVVAFAPSEDRAAYFEDALELCEEYGFDYAYWDYHGWSNRSLDHSHYQSGRVHIPEYIGETPTLGVVKDFFSLNERHFALQPFKKPRCLFDTSHWDTGEWQDQNIRCLNIAWRLSGPCDVTYHEEGPISTSVLRDFDLLVVGNPYGSSYGTEEVSAITEFVKAGGSLLFYANYGIRMSRVNALLSGFGITYVSALVGSPHPAIDDDDPMTYLVESFDVSHPIGEDCVAYMVGWGASFDVSPPAVSVAATSVDTWRDTSRNHKQDPHEETGPFSFIAVSEFGLGRVAAIADDMWSEPTSWQVAGEVVDWLLERERPDCHL